MSAILHRQANGSITFYVVDNAHDETAGAEMVRVSALARCSATNRGFSWFTKSGSLLVT